MNAQRGEITAPEERCDAAGICLYTAPSRDGENPERREGACDYAANIAPGTNTGIRCCADAR